MTGISRALAVLAAGLALVSCAALPNAAARIDVGSGVLELSERVSRDLDRYLTFAAGPVGFAVTADGRHSGAVHCPEARCGSDWQSSLQLICETASEGIPCLVLARGREIVWDGPIIKRSGLELDNRDQLVHYVDGNRTVTRGPAAAQGIIVYLPGAGPDDEATDRTDPSVPPFIRDLNARGWDIHRGNIAASLRLNFAPARALITDALTEHVRNLRDQGYRRVVFAGQSAGGFDVLHLAGQDDRPDAIIAAAPACCGPRVWEDGAPNSAFFRNAVDYYHLLDRLNGTPVVLAFFEQDEYEYADRGATSTDMLARDAIPHLVINRPSGLVGHGASWNSAFAARFSGCIHSFLTTAGDDPFCDPAKLDGDGFGSPTGHAWMTTGDDLALAGVAPMTTGQMMATLPGQTFSGETAQGTSMTVAFDRNGAAESQREDTPGLQQTSFTFSDDQVCFTGGRTICSTIYGWPDGTLLFVSATGRITLRVRPQPSDLTPVATAG